MKQSIDESIICSLQDGYYSEEPRALSMMYCEARRIALILLSSIIARKIRLSPDRVDQVTHDAAARFVSQYIKHPGYWVDKFAIRIMYEVKYVLFDGGHQDRPKKVAQKNTLSIDTVQSPTTEEPIQEDRKDYLMDLYTEHEKGTDILLAIYHSTSFRKAVLAVSLITGRPWCYDRAVKLREVYRMTRRKRNGRVHCQRAAETVISNSKG